MVSHPEDANSTNPRSEEGLDGTMARHAADLVFTQDALGQYLSFYWHQGTAVGIVPDQFVYRQMSPHAGPVDLEHYLGKVRWVLDHLKPAHFREPFCFNGHVFDFELTLSPILLPSGASRTLLVLGKCLTTEPRPISPITVEQGRQSLISEMGLARYQKLFTLIAWNIRRTLDLETIWQQMVNGLGSMLKVDRCVICSYDGTTQHLPIVAEYQRVPNTPLRGNIFDLQRHPQLRNTLQTLTPTTTVVPLPEEGTECALMAVATSYQDHPNGLIVLGYGSRSTEPFWSSVQSQPEALETASLAWSKPEVEAVSELADQVGTALAHAHLFAEAQNLAQELQQANNSLMKQHWELEEAKQQAEEVSRIKSEFLANTSHELRTPLNSMIACLKLVLDDMADSTEEEREFIGEAHKSALLLLSIINDILDIAKIEAGRMDPDLEPVSLNELLADVERKTRIQAENKNLTYELHVPRTRDDIVVCGDYQLMLQVLLNLVGNALKFTHEGGITISAQVKRSKLKNPELDTSSYVQVSVADTGIGVPLDKQSRLFKAFSQVDSSRTRQYGGTGLGLVISQRLIEAMGGQVNFYSMGEGLGSTVTFTVPLYQDPVMMVAEN
ncbi:MAG: GAF domain-containing sensor histidine kinase [Prochlorothrix sp.]|nr:ATP-binding protein [Prochlorothrix sp.]